MPDAAWGYTERRMRTECDPAEGGGNDIQTAENMVLAKGLPAPLFQVICGVLCRLNGFKEIVMPIYEYHCEDCNRDFECLVFGKEQPDCPTCNSTSVCRLMSTCGFVSKGSGGHTVAKSAGSACSGCAASSCSGCGH